MKVLKFNLDIKNLRKEIIREFKHEKNYAEDIINDFVILTFFVGNDYMKAIPYFSDLIFGMDILTEVYKNNKISFSWLK